MRRCASKARMFHRIYTAVDARPLAIPDSKDTIQIGPVGDHDMLRTANGGHGEIFIDAGIEMNTSSGNRCTRLPDRAIEGANRATPIATDIPPGAQPLASIEV